MIGYGRPIDEEFAKTSLQDLLTSFREHEALIDPYGNPIPLNEAKIIAEATGEKTIIKDLIEKTQRMVLQNINLVNTISHERREEIVNKLQTRPDMKQLQKIFQGKEKELILWTKENNNWIPLATDLKTYFQLWEPNYSKIVQNTVEYYLETLLF
jgi:hypothetical protein